MKTLYITECPRDAMQGIKTFIPTDLKLRYIQQLLKVGFDVLDYGSFVSSKAIPQMQDTGEITKQLELSNTKTKLLAIIANYRGAEDACQFEQVSYLGFPLSVSEEFQKRNTNATIEDAFIRVEEIHNLCFKKGKQLRVYLSMAFGNPYGEEWNPEKVFQMAERLYRMGIKEIALADTIGCSTEDNIQLLFSHLMKALPEVNFIAHLHSTPDTAKNKILSAIDNGCINFDSAILGYGGCPMAKDKLTGNIATETLIQCAKESNLHFKINMDEFRKSQDIAREIFEIYH
ncbi:MAG: hydroxymethylglutaryl-CoA lyase [Bacteroidia bacterium]|nr:MAG: hydroxymethylglutaryl-CoA lyase [Bacteroidia bacterium]